VIHREHILYRENTFCERLWQVIVRFIAEGSSSSFFRDRSNLFDILVAKVTKLNPKL
jgi:hypothetical protein